MKKTSTVLAVLLGTFTFAGTASASAIPTILLDQASNLDPAAYAPVGSNSLGVSYTASDWPLIAAAGGQNATVGNNSSNWGTAGQFLASIMRTARRSARCRPISRPTVAP